MDKYGWVIDIHDAFVINGEAAEDCRKWYAEILTRTYEKRNEILAEYFESIGIGAEAQGQWQTLKSMVQPLEDEFKVFMPLK